VDGKFDRTIPDIFGRCVQMLLFKSFYVVNFVLQFDRPSLLVKVVS